MSQVITAKKRRFTAIFQYQRNVYLLLLYSLGKGLQLSVANISINLYAYSLGYHSAFIGLLTGMPALGAIIAAAPSGMLADKLGRKPVIILSAILTPLTLFATALATNSYMLLIAQFANGLVSTAYWITQLPMLTESTGKEERVGVMGVNFFILYGIGSAGSFIGGGIPEIISHITGAAATSVIPQRWGVIAAGVIPALLAIPLIWLKETNQRNNSSLSAEGVHEQTDETIKAATQSKWQIIGLFIMLLLPDIIFNIGESSVSGLIQLFLRLRFFLHPGEIGAMLSIIGAVGGISSLLSPQITRKFKMLRVLVILQYITIPCILLTGFSATVLPAIGGEAIRRMILGALNPIYAVFVMEMVPQRMRATLSGMYGVTYGVGFSAGSAMAGYLQQNIGLSAPFTLGAACLLLAPTLLLLFFGKKAQQTAVS